MITEQITIAATIDENYAQHLGVMLCSLFENNIESKFDIFVLTENISEVAHDKLFALVDSYSHSLIFHMIGTDIFQEVPVKYPHLSQVTYFRLLLPEILNDNISKVLYLDPDLIVMTNILPFWNIDLNDHSHCAVSTGPKDFQDNIGMDITSNYFNAGVLLINLDKWRKIDLISEATQVIGRFHEYIESDQDVLNVIFENQWLPISARWNLIAPFFKQTASGDYDYMSKFTDLEKKNVQQSLNSPGIVHYTGSGACKPWHYLCNHPFQAAYWHYLALTPWKDAKPEEITLKNILIKHTPRTIKNLLKKIG